MKIFKLTLGYVLFFVLFGCQKNNLTPIHADSQFTSLTSIENSSKLSEFLAIRSTEIQKVAYQLLNPSEKYALWRNHLQKFENSKMLTSGQRDVVKGFLNCISPNFFADKNVAVSENYAILEFKMKKLFPMEIRTVIFSSFKTEIEQNIHVSSPNVVAPPPDCNCNYHDDWCTFHNYCGGSTGSCTEKTSGCGTLWQKACDGICKDVTGGGGI